MTLVEGLCLQKDMEVVEQTVEEQNTVVGVADIEAEDNKPAEVKSSSVVVVESNSSAAVRNQQAAAVADMGMCLLAALALAFGMLR